MTAVKGLDFNEVYNLASDFQDGDLLVKVIHINHLIQAKQAAGRLKDLDDVKKLQRKRR